MQSVIFTPPKINWYTREALSALNYKQNCDRFGMFFIPLEDVLRPWLIEGLPEIETVEVVRELKLTVTRPRMPRPERQEEGDETRYPLGEAPTWKQIAGSLLNNPTVLIPRWVEPVEIEQYVDCEPGTVESQAVEIFLTFTCHMWILVNPNWRTRPENRIESTTLAGALRSWSVDGVQKELIAATFKPCHQGGPGRPMMSFSERRKMYFPEDEKEVLNKVWKCLGEAPGYIAKYRRMRKDLDGEGRRTLDECLEELLGLCQCLPDSLRNASGGCVWRVDRKKIALITNPKYYLIKRIGKVGGMRQRGQGLRAAPAHRNARSTAVGMMVHEKVPEEVAEKAYQVTLRGKKKVKMRSGKMRNRRKPPQKRKKVDSQSSGREGSKDDDFDEDNGDGGDEDRDEEGEGDGGGYEDDDGGGYGDGYVDEDGDGDGDGCDEDGYYGDYGDYGDGDEDGYGGVSGDGDDESEGY